MNKICYFAVSDAFEKSSSYWDEMPFNGMRGKRGKEAGYLGLREVIKVIKILFLWKIS